jgi:hypothetical protein
MMSEQPGSDSTASDKFFYVARNYPCGCVTGLVMDHRDKFTAESVAGFITDGRTVSREPWARYDAIRQEPGFMDCSHGQLRLF